MLIGENAQGEADVQMLSMVKDTVLYKELLKNSGLPVLKNPVDIIHTGAAGNSNYIKLWVLTGSQAYSMDRKTFAGSESDVFGNYCLWIGRSTRNRTGRYYSAGER